MVFLFFYSAGDKVGFSKSTVIRFSFSSVKAEERSTLPGEITEMTDRTSDVPVQLPASERGNPKARDLIPSLYSTEVTGRLNNKSTVKDKLITAP